MEKKLDPNYESWPVADAKQRFSKVVEQAQQGIPQIITSHGKPQVAMINVSDLSDFIDVIVAVRKKRLLAASKALQKAATLEGIDTFELATDIGFAHDFEDEK